MTIVAIFVVGALLAGSVYGVWRSHEERKAERLAHDRRVRQRYDAAHRIPRPFNERAAQGFDRRVS